MKGKVLLAAIFVSSISHASAFDNVFLHGAGYNKLKMQKHNDLLTEKNMISGHGKIVKVIDGDTIWVKVNSDDFNNFMKFSSTDDELKALRDYNQTVKMRIGGINTAESVHPDKRRNTLAGKMASRELKQWAKRGSNADYSCYQHGKYGRPVCAVSINNKDIGLHMIANGFSKYVTYFGKSPFYDEEYTKAYLAVKK